MVAAGRVADGVPEAQAVPKGLAFHPCAGGLLAARGLRKISLFDMAHPQDTVFTIGGDVAFSGVSDEDQLSL